MNSGNYLVDLTDWFDVVHSKYIEVVCPACEEVNCKCAEHKRIRDEEIASYDNDK